MTRFLLEQDKITQLDSDRAYLSQQVQTGNLSPEHQKVAEIVMEILNLMRGCVLVRTEDSDSGTSSDLADMFSLVEETTTQLGSSMPEREGGGTLGGFGYSGETLP
jgi:hypothetical protein